MVQDAHSPSPSDVAGCKRRATPSKRTIHGSSSGIVSAMASRMAL
jgi:hypothetical protein